MTIAILARGKCNLSKCITRYLVAMAAADLSVVVLDVLLRHVTSSYSIEFSFMRSLPVCNFHAALLFGVTDCSVWFTVCFTFDRYVAICCRSLKAKYCVPKTTKAVIITVTVLCALKNVFWCFMYTGSYWLLNLSWICKIPDSVASSKIWGTLEFAHYISNPCIPFLLVLSFNALTVRYILVANRARRRVRSLIKSECLNDQEIENRRKSMFILYGVSGNFILLWTLYMVYSIYWRMLYLGYETLQLPVHVRELAFMLQITACCTNTCVYVVIQRKFREEMTKLLKYPVIVIVQIIKKRCK